MDLLRHLERGNKNPADHLTFIEHLAELRRRLIICLGAFAVMAVVSYYGYGHFLTLLERPYCESLGATGKKCALVIQGPLDGFTVRLNTSAYGGLVLASPIILFESWRFVTPGLRANEKRYAMPFALATALLFLAGAYVAWLTFPHALEFLHAASGPGIRDLFTPQKYLSLILALMAIFGLTFEFPVVLVALELAGVLSSAKLSQWRRPSIVIIVSFAAVITPSSDPFSMLAMAIPMLVFYEASILIGKVMHR